MRKLLFTGMSLLGLWMAQAQNRFPKPDFESGYQYPDIHYAVPNEDLWLVVDVIMLVLLMGIVAWAAIKRRTREPIFVVSLVSVAYFGFFRSGCVCSIGSIQNVVLALVDGNYQIPWIVFLFFILPILFAFLFGRVFCAGVCPFGALQDLVHVKDFKIARPIAILLGIVPWVYLAFAILYAATRSSFIICHLDPFVGIFRMGGDAGMITLGAILIVLSIFSGRPFCRFICPYGALLGLVSRFSIWKVKITKHSCINCELCHNACPVDAIRPPYANKVKESRQKGVRRVLMYMIVLPIFMLAGAFLARMVSDDLSRSNKNVRLYEMVMAQESDPQDVLNLELEAFYGQGRVVEELAAQCEAIKADFKLYSTIIGAFIGLVIGLTLVRLSTKRNRVHYEIDHAACVACGRCFSYCPQTRKKPE